MKADADDDLSEAELARLDEALERGFEAVKAGRFRPAQDVIADLRDGLGHARRMADPSKVLAEALNLPVREGLRIVGALMRSVDPEEDEDAAEAWVAEIDRRSTSVENGTAQFVDAAAAHAHVRAVLRARRTSRT